MTHTSNIYISSFLLIAVNISRARDFMRNESDTQGLKAQFLATEDPLKMMKILFHFKSSFCSQDVYIFCHVSSTLSNLP